MEDEKLIDLFFARSEQAVKELSEKYGKLCHSIAFNILGDSMDADECENDTYLRIWNSIPPNRPKYLISYVCKIARNISLNKLKYKTRKKRSAEIDELMSELDECIPADEDITEQTDDETVSKAINGFLRTLDVTTRNLFIRRYFYMESAEALSRKFGMTAGNVSTKLNRIRAKMKNYLLKEGIFI